MSVYVDNVTHPECFEDEHQFIFECKKHDEERIMLYREYGRKITDLYESFLTAMNIN